MSKAPAEESERTKRAREKLKKQLEEIEGQVTSNAVAEKKEEIHRWISRHAPYRVVLPKKNISLFDENQNAASESKKIRQLAEEIKKELQ